MHSNALLIGLAAFSSATCLIIISAGPNRPRAKDRTGLMLCSLALMVLAAAFVGYGAILDAVQTAPLVPPSGGEPVSALPTPGR